MIIFRKVNVNPKDKKTGDCSIRAVANILNLTWDEALDELVAMSHKTKLDTADKNNIDKVMQAHGYKKMKMPVYYVGDKKHRRLVRDMDKETHKDALVLVANHYTCIKNGEIQDTWDCGYKSVGNYWIKEETN